MTKLDTAVIVSVVVTMVVVCCELAALWLNLEDESPIKKRRISSSHVGEEINKTFTNVAIAVNNLAERINTPELVYMLMNKVTNGVISCPFIPPQAYIVITEYLDQDERKPNFFSPTMMK